MLGKEKQSSVKLHLQKQSFTCDTEKMLPAFFCSFVEIEFVDKIVLIVSF